MYLSFGGCWFIVFCPCGTFTCYFDCFASKYFLNWLRWTYVRLFTCSIRERGWQHPLQNKILSNWGMNCGIFWELKIFENSGCVFQKNFFLLCINEGVDHKLLSFENFDTFVYILRWLLFLYLYIEMHSSSYIISSNMGS